MGITYTGKEPANLAPIGGFNPVCHDACITPTSFVSLSAAKNLEADCGCCFEAIPMASKLNDRRASSKTTSRCDDSERRVDAAGLYLALLNALQKVAKK
jgi:hypothetical protein